ncbi:hypothetical protein IL992_12785 [Microbispora sp. NEAU-D428]|uniref:hypothetical protein n=1 Tax=Microbispora sitophila TaxID=2771537 RepID=UPI001865C0D7|nr:hypothetical protein [Microbispora sitophila]MBE3010061.1 hypothetical protein [Microbispora sitophila]
MDKERKQARRIVDAADLRRRWYLPDDQGGLSMGTKRAMVMEASHAVIIHPRARAWARWGNSRPERARTHLARGLMELRPLVSAFILL